MTNIKTNLVFLLFFCNCFLYAQEQKKENTQSLREFIREVENKFSVKFSFSDSSIQGMQSKDTIQTLNLEKAIYLLQNKYGLKVQKLNERYYVIHPSGIGSICGILRNSKSNKPIFGASIKLLGTQQGRVSKRDGSFYFQKTENATEIKIKHLGYKPASISISYTPNGDCIEIAMEERVYQLTEVVVSDYLTKGIRQSNSGFIQIKPNQFGSLPGLAEPDVLQIIQALPGIKSIDETVSDINIRGGTNDQNLVLWNGIKMYQTGHFFGLISAFNPYLTNTVTIFKNGTPVQYTDGVSSTIAIDTKDKLNDHLYAGGGFNMLAADVFAQFPLWENVNLQLSARRSYTDLWRSPTYKTFFNKAFQDTKISIVNTPDSEEGLINQERFYYQDLSAKLLWDIHPKHRIRLSAIQLGNVLNYTEQLQKDGRLLSTNSNLTQNQAGVGIQVKSKWSDVFWTTANAYYSKFNLDANNRSPYTDMVLFQDNEVSETAATLDANWQWKEAVKIQFGIHASETAIVNFTDINRPKYKSYIKDVVRQYAAFAALDFRAFDRRLTGNIGLRTNYYNNPNSFDDGKSFNEWLFEPRLRLTYKFYGGFAIQAKAEKKSQVANQIIDLEQNFLGIEKRRWTLADENQLPITKSRQLALGFLYNQKGWYTAVEGFTKKVDGITTANQGFINEDQFEIWHQGNYTVSGLEFLINKKSEFHSSWLSYAYNRNTYTFEDLNPKQFPNNLEIEHQLTLGTTYNIAAFKLGFGLLWRSGRAYTEPDPQNPIDFRKIPNQLVYQPTNSSTLPAYLRLDTSLSYEFDFWKLKSSIGLSLLNLLNDKQALNIYYRLDESTGSIEKIERLSLGITPNFSFRVTF
ncbi:MAG: TonB-dependent receptor [Flavobacteriaceae bacterium]|nr:TonB-dependent receptor [Flavobacteriaceae bacterium]